MKGFGDAQQLYLPVGLPIEKVTKYPPPCQRFSVDHPCSRTLMGGFWLKLHVGTRNPITNLASHDLVMIIVKFSFINDTYVSYIDIVH
jgi:hypothetical protein